MAVYGACVFIANAVLFLKFTIHNKIGLILFSLMILAYFVFYYLFNLLRGHIQYIFLTSFSQIIVWLTFILTLGQIILLEYALVWIYNSLNNHEDQTKVKEDNLPLL